MCLVSMSCLVDREQEESGRGGVVVGFKYKAMQATMDAVPEMALSGYAGMSNQGPGLTGALVCRGEGVRMR